MSEREFIVRFPGTTTVDANDYAEELRSNLLDAAPDIQAERHRDDNSTMDFGATLVLILGAPATIAAANAIKKWVSRNNQAKLELTTKDGTVLLKNVESKHVAEIVKALNHSGR